MPALELMSHHIIHLGDSRLHIQVFPFVTYAVSFEIPMAVFRRVDHFTHMAALSTTNQDGRYVPGEFHSLPVRALKKGRRLIPFQGTEILSYILGSTINRKYKVQSPTLDRKGFKMTTIFSDVYLNNNSDEQNRQLRGTNRIEYSTPITS